MRVHTAGRARAALFAIVSASVVAPLLPQVAGANTVPSVSWPYPNGTLANRRVAAGSAISSSNIDGLRQAWTFKLTGKGASTVGHYGSLAANPIVVNGTVYLQDLESDVYALRLSTGALEWEHKVGQPERSGPGPNGVAVVGTVVYGLAPTSAFALDAKTGATIWTNRKLLTKGEGTLGIQPQVATGRVYLASQYGSGPGGGVLMALDAKNGSLLWKFDTSTGYSPGVKALGLGSGGAWETPLVGTDGSVTFGTGNPYQRAVDALRHPARQLYTDSDVNLTATTGKLRWYYQGVPNDFLDWDMQTSPIAATASGVPVVIGSGKMGVVYEMNAATGRLRWKAPVGKHNGHDNVGRLALEHKSKLKAPFTTLPGSFGGVLTNLALSGTTIYVATLDLALAEKTLTTVTETVGKSRPAGEIEALDLATGKVEWDTKVSDLPLGAVTVSNDLVVTTLLNGELLALDRATGAVVYRHELPTSTNAPLAIAGDTIVVPAGGLRTSAKGKHGHPQVVAYRVP